ncbi:MAG: hypothetical protein ACR9NN_10745 [Nostochopsis sp.]
MNTQVCSAIPQFQSKILISLEHKLLSLEHKLLSLGHERELEPLGFIRGVSSVSRNTLGVKHDSRLGRARALPNIFADLLGFVPQPNLRKLRFLALTEPSLWKNHQPSTINN